MFVTCQHVAYMFKSVAGNFKAEWDLFGTCEGRSEGRGGKSFLIFFENTFQYCYKEVLNMLLTSSKHVFDMFQSVKTCFKHVCNMFQRVKTCFKHVLSMFQRIKTCFKHVFNMFQRPETCFKHVFNMFSTCFRG